MSMSDFVSFPMPQRKLPHANSVSECVSSSLLPPPTPLQRKFPHVMSMSDFVRWRYGFWAQFYVVLLMLFNMSVGE